MDRETAFEKINPIICFLYIIGAMALCMFTMHPVACFAVLVMTLLLYVNVCGRGVLKRLPLLLVVYSILSVSNPLFNTRGKTVLFTYFGGRAFTLEALCYGMVLAAVFISVLMLFGVYHRLMTSDKLMYIFGGLAPSVCLVLSMVLRLVPHYGAQIKKINTARYIKQEGKYSKAANVMSAMTTWSLESGILMADSMKCRGYGCGARGRFSIYSMKGKDIAVLVLASILFSVVLICRMSGGLDAAFMPDMKISGADNIYFVMAMWSMILYLAIPIVINVTEAVKWHILR
ncbi:MAG: energy-coupling factor transporter transmembrane protein EcfT [Clostridium sp.]|nr:energy-coupling factor transporter transmembrane protein EcfT [Clostridium sp.]MCM1399022.1 energy-coupling factor transporter transmembrane protein EcfT [Clostridium sp.]MCM1458881.1 energy-coupling factor transporter transmembrane protein EcfT [Bacteroides sp.]